MGSNGDVWQLYFDDKTHLPFYYNVVTGKSVWSLPDDRWHKARDLQSGRCYYFNLRRQASTWAEPPGYREEDFSKCYVLPYDNNTLGLGSEKKNFTGFIPTYDISRGTHFWSSKRHTVWEKPGRSEYALDDLGQQEEYEELEARARLLQSNIHSVSDEFMRLEIIEKQMQATAAARRIKVAKLKNEKRMTAIRKPPTKGNNKQGVSRYLETSLNRVGFRQSVRTNANHTVDSFLKSVPLFHNLTEAQFGVVRKALRTQAFQPNEVIIRQDTKGDLLYLIQEGKVRIYKAGLYSEEQGLLDEDSVFGKMVNELIAGDYFGERSLITDKPRSATVVATTHVICFTLDSETFRKVIDSVDAIIDTSNSALTHSNDEVSSLSKHINNYDCLLSLKRKANTLREERVADALMQLMTAFSPELNVQDTVERMSKTLYNIFGCERISVYYVDWVKKELNLQIAKEPKQNQKKITLPIGKGIAGHCAAINKLVNVPHVHKSKHFYGKIDEENGFTTRSVLCCPVTELDGTVIAVIQLINKRGGAPFSEEDEDVIASVSEQMSLTLAQQKAEHENDHSMANYIPIWKMEENFSVKIKRFLGTSLPGHIASESVVVAVSIFYAGERLAETKFVQEDAERLTPYLIVKYDQLVSLDVKLSNLPRAARVIFNVYYAKEDINSKNGNDILNHLASNGLVGLPAPVPSQQQEKSEMVVNTLEENDDDISFPDDSSSRGAGRRKRRFKKNHLQYQDTAVSSEDVNLNDISATPIGWAGCHLFDFDQILRSGHLRLKLFRGECTPDLAAVATLLSDTTRTHVDFLELEFPVHEKPIIYTDYVSKDMKNKEVAPLKSHIYKMMKKEIDTFIHQDPLKPLTRDQKLLIMQARTELMDDPEALPKFLLSINWCDRASIQMGYKHLNRWATPDPVVALQLLDYHFPDPKIRSLSVSLLENLSDEELQLYMLQLTQVLKFERFVDSALCRFLLRRALRSPQTIGQRFFWFLKSELHVKEVKDRYGAILDLYLRHCRGTRHILGHAMFVLNKLEAISRSLVPLKQKERTPFLRQQLKHLVLPEKFQLPLDPDYYFKSISIPSCRVMNSKKAPLMLELTSAHVGGPAKTILFKVGDDLRQDQLTLQVLRVMDKLWKQHGLDLQMSCYGCVSTGNEQGLIEVVPNSQTIAKITAGGGKSKIAKAVKVFDDKKLKSWLSKNGYSRKVSEKNFAYSCAGYCVATYVLGIGDRHNDNLMLTKDGKLFHIDFGHFLGHFKKKLGIKRERAPFIFTPAMATILGRVGSPKYAQFVVLCGKAFNILRKHANLLITLFSLMLSCGIPELTTASDISWLREKLMLEATDEEAAEKFKTLIQESLNSWSVQLNDFAHIVRRN